MKLAALQALSAAIDEGSLRNAARRLGLSQPALSKAVRELEKAVGAPLLVRTTQGVVPTAQGKVLHAHSLTVLRELGAARDGIAQLSGRMSGELVVGAVPVAVMLLIPETLRTYGREFPDMRLRISEELFLAQLQRLRKGEVDVAVGGVPQAVPSGEFVAETLIETEMVVVVRKGSPRAKARSLTDLSAAKWVYTGASSEEGYARTLHLLHGLPPPPVGAVVNSTLALLSIVATGDFVGLMPRQITAHPLATQFLSVVPVREQGVPVSVQAITRRDAVVAPAVRHFIAHLHRAAHQLKQHGPA
jgi:LysR family transcriptional regulator of abg operon